jgi:hypothetical protein
VVVSCLVAVGRAVDVVVVLITVFVVADVVVVLLLFCLIPWLRVGCHRIKQAPLGLTTNNYNNNHNSSNNSNNKDNVQQ